MDTLCRDGAVHAPSIVRIPPAGRGPAAGVIEVAGEAFHVDAVNFEEIGMPMIPTDWRPGDRDKRRLYGVSSGAPAIENFRLRIPVVSTDRTHAGRP